MSTKSAAVMQATALLAEVLWRMELPFAIVRFGRREAQRVLKAPDSPFSPAVGQAVMVSMLRACELSRPLCNASPPSAPPAHLPGSMPSPPARPARPQVLPARPAGPCPALNTPHCAHIPLHPGACPVQEAMTYDEGTKPASACSFIAKNVFKWVRASWVWARGLLTLHG
jgi:hypothetical protein